MGDVLDGFGEPASLVAEETRRYNGVEGVHVVWDEAGDLVYVGESGRTGDRLREHLTGDRQASTLHNQVGRLLDAELGRPATRDEIRGWLERCDFAVHATADRAAVKASVMDAYAPRFNTVRPPERGSSRGLPELFQAVLDAIDRGGNGRVRAALDAAAAAVDTQLPADVTVLPLREIGGWTIRMARPAAPAGLHLRYVFNRENLTLALAAEWIRPFAARWKRVIDIRDAFPQRDLGHGEPTTAGIDVYRFDYDGSKQPLPDWLRGDLLRLHEIWRDAVEAGFDSDSPEPVHLVVKWNAARNPRTVELHKAVADERGTVWWGNRSEAVRAPMSKAKVDALRAQLEAGVETYCVVYRRGEAWLTRLHAVTTDRDAVDRALLPDYYAADECNIFYLLSDFRRMPEGWARDSLLVASNPDPDAIDGALGNQTTPLPVFIRAKALKELAPDAAPPPARRPEVPRLTFDWLVEQTLWEPAALQKVLDAIEDRPQVVLTGPPGTGKTHVATALARYLTQDAPLTRRLVQFHPSYGYEDFVEGLRPVPVDGQLTFDPRPGALLRLADEMGDERRVLVIDEMNRANLPRVFGELMYLLEYRDRGEPVDLLYREAYTLPAGLVFIGTMNTADRSTRTLDVALRRRFDFFECPPDPAILTKFYEARAYEVPGLADGMAALNDWLTARLDRHHTIGHTFFMRDGFTPARLRAVWERQLMPLIEDYFFDQPDVVRDLAVETFWPSFLATD